MYIAPILGQWPCHTWCHHLLPDHFVFGCHGVFMHGLSRVSATPAPSACQVALQHICTNFGCVNVPSSGSLPNTR